MTCCRCCDCGGGDYPRDEDLQAELRRALAALRDGDTAKAETILGEACGDIVSENRRRKDAELADLMGEWIKLPQPRPEFLTFAHKRRKWSLV